MIFLNVICIFVSLFFANLSYRWAGNKMSFEVDINLLAAAFNAVVVIAHFTGWLG